MSTSAKASYAWDQNILTAGHSNNINSTLNYYSSAQDDPMQTLRKHIAMGALHDSNERFDAPKCHADTRIAILDRIAEWATDSSEEAKSVLWLSGPAGAGKSAIAQTLVERWKKDGMYIIAFFFWRTASGRNQKTRLVPTIAYQLLELFPSIKPMIEAAICTMGLFDKRLSVQLDKLVVEPLCSIPKGQTPIVLVIDGLDECCVDLPKVEDFPGQNFESQQREILDALGSACSKLTWVRFFIVSRPEKQLRESFSSVLLEERSIPISLKDASDADADIRLFLDCEFDKIRKRHSIGTSWPTEAQLAELLRKSSGQFIYPAVAIKHIRTRANPIQSLQAVLKLQPGSVDKPLAELDMLYTLVLNSISTDSVPVVKDILGYFLPYGSEFPVGIHEVFSPETVQYSPRMFERFLFLSEGEVNSHLTDLHSVMDIPLDSQHPIKLIHATFSEYLQDKSRSGDYFIGRDYLSTRYALQLFRHMEQLGPSAKQDSLYYGISLFQCFCYWTDHCPPSKSLAICLWSLMRTKIGHYPSPVHHSTNHLPLANKQLSTRFTAIGKSYGNEWIRDILKYIEKCNIPEIEPSWWRRFQIRLRLKAALLKNLG